MSHGLSPVLSTEVAGLSTEVAAVSTVVDELSTDVAGLSTDEGGSGVTVVSRSTEVGIVSIEGEGLCTTGLGELSTVLSTEVEGLVTLPIGVVVDLVVSAMEECHWRAALQQLVA
jgi:hypothetical protein